MKMLEISDSLKFPIDAATQTFALIGRKGSGKTYGAGKVTELLIRAGVQVVILDTVGNWFGLRIAANGKDAGLDVPILGGLRGDVPLDATQGALVADVATDTGSSLVLDCSQFSKADRQRFAFTFGEQLWKRKKAEELPSPIHIVFEEAQLIVPEYVGKDQAKMVGIFEEIIRLGRNYGIGVSMITQRPQSVNKEVLNQTECLLVFQVNGFHERKALKDWIRYQGMDVSLVDELPSLKPGNCYVWSPQWLDILKKIHIAPKETFDSTSTPKVGGVNRTRTLKPIDLEGLKLKMAASIERAKSDDPVLLRKRIRELELEAISSKNEITMAHLEKSREVGFSEGAKKYLSLVEEYRLRMTKLSLALEEAIKIVNHPLSDHGVDSPKPARTGAFEYHKKVISPERPKKVTGDGLMHYVAIPPVGQKILDALYELEQMGSKIPKRVMVAFLAGYSNLNSKGFTNAIGTLSTKGLIHYPRDGRIALTDDGRKQAYPVPPKRSPAEVQERVIGMLRGASERILRPLINVYPDKLSRTEVAAIAGYTNLNSKGFTNALGRLSSLGFVSYPEKGYCKAAPVLFLEE